MDSALNELMVILEKNAELVVSFLDTLIPLILTIINKEMKDDVDPVIVLCGLRVIRTMANLPLDIVFKYAQDVVNGLLPILDCKQRVIRKYAASTRNLWFMIHYPCLSTNTPFCSSRFDLRLNKRVYIEHID